MSYPNEEEIVVARRALPDAQRALLEIGAAVAERSSDFFACGWYGTTVSDERGAFAVVRAGGPLEPLVGDIVRLVSDTGRSTVAYVAESVAGDLIPTDIGVTRRAFAALSILAVESVQVRYEVLS